MPTKDPDRERVVWRVRPWCRAANISPTKFYKLSGDERPREIELAGVRYIGESPTAWRDRLLEEGDR